MQLWLDKNRLPASGTLKSTVVRIWYRTPSGRPHKVYFVSLACLPSVFVQFFCSVRHFFTQSIIMRSVHLCQNKAYMDKTHNNLYLLKKNGFQSRNGLSKAQACLLYAVCACNYIHLPLARQHKPSIFVSRFAPSRHFLHAVSYRAEPSRLKKKHRCTRINTDEAQIKNKKYPCPIRIHLRASVLICVKTTPSASICVS